MALPKIEIKLLTPAEASIEVGGKAIGKLTIALAEQETIDGIDNAIVVIGNCLNLQDNVPYGFTFGYNPNVITGVKLSDTTAPKGA